MVDRWQFTRSFNDSQGLVHDCTLYGLIERPVGRTGMVTYGAVKITWVPTRRQMMWDWPSTSGGPYSNCLLYTSDAADE